MANFVFKDTADFVWKDTSDFNWIRGTLYIDVHDCSDIKDKIGDGNEQKEKEKILATKKRKF